MAMDLEQMVKSGTKVMVLSDFHIPYQNNKAVQIAMDFAKDYKPDKIVLNGDMIDFYGISDFDKCPDRRKNIAEEVEMTKEFLTNLRSINKKSQIYFLEGNHENRLQKYVWRHPELHGLGALDINNMLQLDKNHIQIVRASNDYWGKEAGHLEVGDTVIMHGDSRINGCKGGAYAAKNTAINIAKPVIMGHTHRLSEYNVTNRYNDLKGVECGCLCQIPKLANWQNGFVTFETIKGKNHNYRLHRIEKNMLIESKKIYK